MIRHYVVMVFAPGKTKHYNYFTKIVREFRQKSALIDTYHPDRDRQTDRHLVTALCAACAIHTT